MSFSDLMPGGRPPEEENTGSSPFNSQQPRTIDGSLPFKPKNTWLFIGKKEEEKTEAGRL